MSNLRKIAVVCTFVFVVVAVVSSVYGISSSDLTTTLGSHSGSSNVKTAAQKVWGTVATVVQILAVAAVVVAGVRYMFASADAKADIKKQTVILIVGAVLVFGATAILQFVDKATNDIL